MPLAMDGILNRFALNHLDALAVHRLLQAVAGNHVQLTNAVLRMIRERERFGRVIQLDI